MGDNTGNQEKLYRSPEMMLEELAEKMSVEDGEKSSSVSDGRTKLVLGGCSGRKRQEFTDNLTHLVRQHQVDITVADGPEQAKDGDYVLLFCGDSETAASWEQKKDDADRKDPENKKQSFDYPQMLFLAGQMEHLVKIHPQAAVLVSDYCVYGRSFGGTEKKKENELGYVCHTSAGEVSAQCMRTAEHLACRLARENGLNLKVARTENNSSGDAGKQMIAAVLQVLLEGKSGEIYNLPDTDIQNKAFPEISDEICKEAGVLTWKEKRSPLSAMKIVPDTAKYEGLSGMRDSVK